VSPVNCGVPERPMAAGADQRGPRHGRRLGVQGFAAKRRAPPVAPGVLRGVGLVPHVVTGLDAPSACATPRSGLRHGLHQVIKGGASFAVRRIGQWIHRSRPLNGGRAVVQYTARAARGTHPNASPQDMVGPSDAAVAYEGDDTTTPGGVSDDPTSVGDAGLIGG
jgi:hypothetical protein